VDTRDHTEREARSEPGSLGSMTQNVARGTLDSWRARQALLQVAVLAVAVAAAAVVVGWLLLRSEGGTAIPTVSGGPTLVSQTQLEDFAKTVDRPLYWAGPKDGFSLELTQTTGGRIFVRYLPRGVAAGDPRPEFLSVGTYAGPSSFADLKRASARTNAVSLELPGGGLAVFDSKKPTSVYFGYPDAKYQVEVFSPSGETARTLVLTGHVTPVD
jgi:hypothetical protein